MAAIRMPILQLGSTELIVSRLGLGLAALGRPAYINLGRQQDFGPDRSVAELERRSHQMLDAAYSVYPMTYCTSETLYNKLACGLSFK